MALRVIVFSSLAPIEPFRLLGRIEKEVAGAEVAGLVYEERVPKKLPDRVRTWSKNLREPGYIPYVAERIVAAIARPFRKAGRALLKFAQASTVSYRDPNAMSLSELAAVCRERKWSFHLTTSIHGQDCLDFVKAQNADLGIVLGTRILKPALYEIPRLGSVNIHKRKVPDYRGAGPVGLWEMLDNQQEIGITVHRVAEKVDTGAVIRAENIAIDPYDTTGSLALKAGLVGEELLLQTARDFVSGNLQERTQKGTGKVFKGPKAHELRLYQKRLARNRSAYRTPFGRPLWKLLLRSSLYLWFVPIRNWRRRIQKRFPVVILYHHLISDRPHPMGQPTEKFLEHLRYLKHHYRLVGLEEAVRVLHSGKVEEPTAVLTFDDGYAENFLNLRAVLRVEPTPVVMFVCPELIEQGKAFPHDVRDRREGFGPLTPAQLQRMDAEGMEIGSHTRTHFDCGATDRPELDAEIAGPRKDLERLLGHAVRWFSFPWGKHPNMSAEAVEIASENYDGYCSAYGGVNAPGVASRHLKRPAHPFSVWELELALQNVLEFQDVGKPASAAQPAAARKTDTAAAGHAGIPKGERE